MIMDEEIAQKRTYLANMFYEDIADIASIFRVLSCNDSEITDREPVVVGQELE